MFINCLFVCLPTVYLHIVTCYLLIYCLFIHCLFVYLLFIYRLHVYIIVLFCLQIVACYLLIYCVFINCLFTYCLFIYCFVYRLFSHGLEVQGWPDVVPQPQQHVFSVFVRAGGRGVRVEEQL